MFNFASDSDIAARKDASFSLKYSANVTDNKLFEAAKLMCSYRSAIVSGLL